MTVAYYLFTNEQNARIRLPQCSYCTVHARTAKESLSFYLLGNEFFSWKPSLMHPYLEPMMIVETVKIYN